MSLDYGKHHEITTYEKGQPTGTKHYYEIPVLTSREDIPKDIFDALRVLTNGTTNKLELEIVVSQAGNWRMKKKWAE